MFGEEIFLEIDHTLDRLIRNAETVAHVNIQDLSETEIEGFQKTQESLLHHLIHMDQMLESKRKNIKMQDKRSASCKIQEKLRRFEQLKSLYHKRIGETAARKHELLSKRRAKKVLIAR